MNVNTIHMIDHMFQDLIFWRGLFEEIYLDRPANRGLPVEYLLEKGSWKLFAGRGEVPHRC